MKLNLNKTEQIDEKEDKSPKIIRFMVEYSLYPNGKLYFLKQYQIGEERMKQKKKDKELFVADEEEIEEEF